MPLETGSFILDLNASNPQSTDSVAQADDHIRLIKSTVKATFPNVTGAVTDPGHKHTLPTGEGYRAGAHPYLGATDVLGTTKNSGSNTTGISVSTSVASTGSSGTNANLQPYIVVYMWKRTA